MVQVSKNKVRNEVLIKIYDLFFRLFLKANNKNKLEKLIEDVLSPTEKIMIAKRIAIIYLLTKQINYSNISNTLKVSLSTISKFNLSLKKYDGIISLINTEIQNEQMMDFFEELVLSVRGPGVPGVHWSSAWKKKNQLELKKIRGI